MPHVTSTALAIGKGEGSGIGHVTDEGVIIAPYCVTKYQLGRSNALFEARLSDPRALSRRGARFLPRLSPSHVLRGCAAGP